MKECIMRKAVTFIGLGCLLLGQFVLAEPESRSGNYLVQPPETILETADKCSPPGERIRVAFYNIQYFTDGHRDGSG